MHLQTQTPQQIKNLKMLWINWKTRKKAFLQNFQILWKDKIKYDKELKTRFENPNNQPARIKDVPEEKPTILITAESYDFKGNKVDVGYYQVEFKKKTENIFLN